MSCAPALETQMPTLLWCMWPGEAFEQMCCPQNRQGCCPGQSLVCPHCTSWSPAGPLSVWSTALQPNLAGRSLKRHTPRICIPCTLPQLLHQNLCTWSPGICIFYPEHLPMPTPSYVYSQQEALVRSTPG